MTSRKRLNLPAIEQSLLIVQSKFPEINRRLSDKREPLTDEVVEFMLDGYRCIDEYFACNIDPFEVGQSERMLELNRIVLCGGSENNNNCSKSQSKATRKHFYEDMDGVADVMEWLDIHRNDNTWKRAAGVFTRILSQPQLYLEGNHRTGALLMSHLLISDGKPPFVLNVDNAVHFFEPASLIKKRKKRGLDKLLQLPMLTKRLAKQLKRDADKTYLLKE